jgi:hypothetical protein
LETTHQYTFAKGLPQSHRGGDTNLYKYTFSFLETKLFYFLKIKIRVGRVTQAVRAHPSKGEALSSNPDVAKKKKKNYSF